MRLAPEVRRHGCRVTGHGNILRRPFVQLLPISARLPHVPDGILDRDWTSSGGLRLRDVGWI